MKSLIARRRDARAVCPSCRSPDYRRLPPQFPGAKPDYQCGSCGRIWQCGRDGGVYEALKE